MGTPRVSILIGNGNLGLITTGDTGIVGLIAAIPAENDAGYGVPVLLQTKQDAKNELGDSDNASVLAAVKDYFFNETPEGAKLYAIFVANTNTLTDLTDSDNDWFTILENFAGKKLRVCAFIKYPDGEYSPTTTNGFDADVHTAVANAQDLVIAQQAANKPFRAIIQGYGATNAAGAKDYATDNKNGVAIVAANINDDSAIPALLLLARLAKFPVQRNPGRIKDGSLAIGIDDVVNVGNDELSTVAQATLDAYDDKRYIVLQINEDAPGYIFSDGLMLTAPTDDYNSIMNGRVIDEAQRIAYATAYKILKDEVEVDAGGRLPVVIEKNLEATMEDAINKGLAGSISNVSCLVNPDTTQYAAWYLKAGLTPNLNLLMGGNLYVFITIRPLGYYTDIIVPLGFTAN